MKTLVMKNVTLLLFVCACIMSAQVVEAKCCGKNDGVKEAPKATTVVDRIKKKIAQILNKNNEIVQGVEDGEEAVTTEECSLQDGQCPVSQENTEKKNEANGDETRENETIHTLSATELAETIAAIIDAEVKIVLQNEDNEDDENKEEDASIN